MRDLQSGHLYLCGLSEQTEQRVVIGGSGGLLYALEMGDCGLWTSTKDK